MTVRFFCDFSPNFETFSRLSKTLQILISMKNYEEDKHLDTFRDFTRLNENSNVTLKATVTLEQLDTLSR